MSGRQIDRLLARAGRNNELTYCECFLDGEDFSYYVKPLTPAQIVEAQKGIKKGEENSDLETAVKLLTLRALNADGTLQYQRDAYNLLMRMPLDDLTALVSAVPDEEVDTELDIKSSGKATEARQSDAGGVNSSRKAGKNAD